MKMEVDHNTLKSIKLSIKKFECSFESAYNRKPTKEEIAQNPTIYKHYKIYNKFKKSQNETLTCNDHGAKYIENIQSNNESIAKSRVWSKHLNKINTINPNHSAKNDNSSNILLGSVTQKIRQLSEQRYVDDTITNKPFAYSLRFRQKVLFDKSKEISNQIKQQKVKDKEDGSNLIDSIDVDSRQVVFTVNESHSEDISEAIDNFCLDDLNNFIKDSILNCDSLTKSNDVYVEKNRKRIYDIEDVSNGQKRLKTNAMQLLTMMCEPQESVAVENSHQQPKKFFKSKASPSTYNVHNFFDHHKSLDFDANTKDCSILKTIELTAKSIYSVDHSPSSNDAVSNETDLKDTKPSKKKMKNENYRKLTMKKKFMSRGYKKFNMKQYKYKSWQKNKKTKHSDVKCFSCGQVGHFASECDNIPTMNVFEPESVSHYTDGDVFDKQANICLNEPLFTDVEDCQLDALVTESLLEFDHKEFRQNQKETVKRILCGQSTLLISPTGFGKSLCYQLAAYCFWKMKKLITIVISPLISLMQDQLLNLPPCLKAVCLNSSQSDKEKSNSINAIITCQAQVLFLSPECIVNGFHSINFESFSRVAFVCIDEAHCLAEWSNNFRPSYLHLFKILHYKLNIKTILSMTATANKETIQIICKNLQLNSTTDVLGSTRVPDNLVLTVSKENNKIVALIELLQSEPFKSLNSIIIYCTRREQTEQIESYIRTSLQFNVAPKDINNLVRSYHAGLSSFNRTHIQKNFISGKLRIVVATIAFGMGINKKDIRAIIHYNMPKSFENYIQEIGRAGRDGKESFCHLFLDNDGEDLFGLQNYIYQNGVDKPNLRKLVANIFQPCKCQAIAENAQVAQSEAINCPGHPVALPILSTEVSVDMKSENIYTLLMCLEMDYSKYPIQVMPPTNSMCCVLNFGDQANMALLIKKNVILHMGALLAKQSSKVLNLSNFKFSIFQVARMLGKSVSQVKSELKKLEWTVENGKRTKSSISVRYSDFSFHIKSPGTLNDSQIEQVVDYLYSTIDAIECKQINKLRSLYSKFNEFTLIDRNDPLARENSIQLKRFIHSYFQCDSLANEQAASSLYLPYTFDQKKLDSAWITSVITEMIHLYYESGVNTPRKMARILQGISSPKFPVEIWGKVHQYWRSVFKVDFKHLMDLCRECLISNYSIK